MSIGYQLLDVPFPQMISKLAISIADGQHALDKSSIKILKEMGDKKNAPVYLPKIKVDANGELVDSDDDTIETSMIGAGFQPTFYQFVETIIEVKMAISMSYSSEYEYGYGSDYTRESEYNFSNSNHTIATCTSVDARYSSKYSYTAEGSSLLRTRLVPMPPNPFMQRLLDIKAQAMQLDMELKMKEAELALEIKKAELADSIKQAETNATNKIKGILGK